MYVSYVQTGPLWQGTSVAQTDGVLAALFAVLSPGIYLQRVFPEKPDMQAEGEGRFCGLTWVDQFGFYAGSVIHLPFPRTLSSYELDTYNSITYGISYFSPCRHSVEVMQSSCSYCFHLLLSAFSWFYYIYKIISKHNQTMSSPILR